MPSTIIFFSQQLSPTDGRMSIPAVTDGERLTATCKGLASDGLHKHERLARGLSIHRKIIA
jgi:hypothetical protein